MAILAIFVSVSTSMAQKGSGVTQTSDMSEELRKNLIDIRTGYLRNIEHSTALLSLRSPALSMFNTKTLYLPNHQPSHYGAFCRIESKIEATSKVPVRFRLGSLDYVNSLERKYVLERPKKSKKQK